MFRLSEIKIPRPRVGATVVNLLVAAYLVCCDNGTFWNMLNSNISGHLGFHLLIGLSLFLVFNIFLSLVSFRPVHKPVLIVIMIAAACINYFMWSYGVVIDSHMITNVLATDASESSELMTWPLFKHLFLLGVLPSALLILTRISIRPWRRELLARGEVILCSSALLAGIILPNYKEFVLFYRNNDELRMYVNPTYPIYSLIKVFKRNNYVHSMEPLKVIAPDAVKQSASHKTAIVLVVGETARSQEFSLNGYERTTNPQLNTRDIYNFTDVQSCGTDTAESLPCMFSHLGKDQFSRDNAKSYENLLDVMQRVGVKVFWRDNNSGSKGIADRVTYEDLSSSKDDQLCSSGECYDEVLLKDLGKMLNRNSGDTLIVLHQKGSHGPSYYKRSPKDFKIFLPECTQDNVQDCDRQTIINAYDNTIVYTDYVLAKLIDILKSQPYATAMLYVSDHGESLGENNFYLHGLPYVIAPEQQTHVPMVFWASGKFLNEKNINPALLTRQQHSPFTHDNLFHSLLGLFRIKTELYRSDLDIFHAAQRSGL
ncbi:MAG: phosphoethanolamine--lipid A transferase [Deltaproteobacteria bacterium]|nr:phosphoethanolamine--lipid A transferase [Deltaproteobacteria bacterium]